MKRYDDRSTMQEPGVCFVCEQTPSDGVGYVDTDSNFAPGFPSSLSGRKYVCDGCVKSVAGAAGYFKSDAIEAADQAADEAVASFNAVRDYVAGVAKQLTDSVLVDVASKAPVFARAAHDVAEAKAEAKAATKKA